MGPPLRLALAGPMGVGKSSVGRLLASRRRLPFVDLDELLGDIPAIFAAEGELGFRRREREALARAAEGEGVLALGGGAIVSTENRGLLHGWQVVVLMARPPTLRRRIGEDPTRPLLADLDRLWEERRALYEAAGPVVWTDGIAPEAVVRAVEAACCLT